MKIRNRQYDNGSKPVSEFERVIISVGNLSTGGTGKSPMIEYLIRMLRVDFKIATVSRGYGRKTRGERIAGPDDSARSLGDEPFQFYRKYGDDIKVVVGAERIMAIPYLLADFPEIDLILLDDAYQHRKVARDFNIMLTEYSAPFYSDFILPTGNLRESRAEAKRASAIIVTKCPELMMEEKETIKAKIHRHNPEAPVFFSRIRYSQLKPVFNASEPTQNVVVISAIANPESLYLQLLKQYKIIEKFEFIDHYNFKSSDLDRIYKKLKDQTVSIVTTEKDMVRLLPFSDHALFQEYNLFYQPIEVELDEPEKFEKLLMETIEKRKGELNS